MLGKRIVEVPMDLICVNPDQPRKMFKEEEIKELSDSIKEYGVLQPIILKKDNLGLYTIVAGERRYKASLKAGLKKIPAIIKNVDEKEMAVIALVENVQRENLSFMEEAYAYKKLMEDYSLTQNEIAKRVGKQQSTISNKIRILNLPQEIQKIIYQNNLTERHARALLKIDDDNVMKNVIMKVVNNNLNVSQTEKLVEEIIRNKEFKERENRKISYISYKIYLNTLRKAFGDIVIKEKRAKFYQEDKGDIIEVKIVIPKNLNNENRVLKF